MMSKIIESNKITDVLKHVDEKTLVVFDIDNTLIDTVQEFGGYAWSINMTKRFLDKGFDFSEALVKSYALLGDVIEEIDFKVIEPETASVITKLREKNILSMALTARMLTMSSCTDRSLLGVNINFFEPAICGDTIQFSSTAGYTNGVLYAGPDFNNKGECLTLFLDKINYSLHLKISYHQMLLQTSQPYFLLHQRTHLCYNRIIHSQIVYLVWHPNLPT